MYIFWINNNGFDTTFELATVDPEENSSTHIIIIFFVVGGVVPYVFNRDVHLHN